MTDLAHDVEAAHTLDLKPKKKGKGRGRGRGKTIDGVGRAIDELSDRLPKEREYMPHCSQEVLRDLGMLPGETAEMVARIGLGKSFGKET